MRDETEQDALKVLRCQSRHLAETENRGRETAAVADAAILEAGTFLTELGMAASARPSGSMEVTPTSGPITSNAEIIRPWHEIVAEAVEVDASPASIEDILDNHEIEAVFARLQGIRDQFDEKLRLDGCDYTICGIAGVLAGLIDIFLVQVPKHPGFLGSQASEGGWLSNVVKEKFGELLPPSTIRSLEREFPVPFDPSTSRGLDRYVEGLGPAMHRFQSLGHDPVLGWIVGVRDVLSGTFTAIAKDGTLIVQNAPGHDPLMLGETFFVAVLEALRTVGGHLLSDVSTSAGLPAPLMPLAEFLQFGTIGERGYTVGELARQMYRGGYDFRHFIA
ncbi:MAG: hypothetical protein WCJ64_03395, partial [Rhodospirillaceae bacterium]